MKKLLIAVGAIVVLVVILFQCFSWWEDYRLSRSYPQMWETREEMVQWGYTHLVFRTFYDGKSWILYGYKWNRNSDSTWVRIAAQQNGQSNVFNMFFVCPFYYHPEMPVDSEGIRKFRHTFEEMMKRLGMEEKWFESKTKPEEI